MDVYDYDDEFEEETRPQAELETVLEEYKSHLGNKGHKEKLGNKGHKENSPLIWLFWLNQT